jgi:hypothetical protein
LGIFSKSSVFCVNTVRRCRKAIAAIRRSIVTMRIPCRRRSSNTSADSLSNERTMAIR